MAMTEQEARLAHVDERLERVRKILNGAGEDKAVALRELAEAHKELSIAVESLRGA